MDSKRLRKTTSILKNTNSFEILRALYIAGTKTRTDLSKELHISLPTVLRSIDPYLNELIFIQGKNESKGGRRPERLTFNYFYRKIGGIQVDKNFFTISVSDLNRKPLIKEKVPFDCTNPHILSKTIHSTLLQYSRKNLFSSSDLEVLTIAVAGSVNEKEGIAVDFPLKWNEISTKSFFEGNFYQDFPNCTVIFENDANALAIGELADRGYNKENIIGVYLSSGVGLGVVINGRLYSGSHGRAGEIGDFLSLFEVDNDMDFENFFNECKDKEKILILQRLINNLSLLFDPDEVVVAWDWERNKGFKVLHELSINNSWKISRHEDFAVVNGALSISAMSFLKKIVYGDVKKNYFVELL
ncbi:ROK family protein [Mesoaciditoga lauensis]|uniref:ROK family protein n=1 Tax=Mesoaciditoga lauensis TaxID=1495039 RepID=UPI0005647EFB|nr:ROK family protein [Mesoaciditoga lauensis]